MGSNFASLGGPGVLEPSVESTKPDEVQRLLWCIGLERGWQVVVRSHSGVCGRPKTPIDGGKLQNRNLSPTVSQHGHPYVAVPVCKSLKQLHDLTAACVCCVHAIRSTFQCAHCSDAHAHSGTAPRAAETCDCQNLKLQGAHAKASRPLPAGFSLGFSDCSDMTVCRYGLWDVTMSRASKAAARLSVGGPLS